MTGNDVSMSTIETGDRAGQDSRRDDPAPGLVMISSAGQPKCLPTPFGRGALDLGRIAREDAIAVDDDRISRRHARVVARGEGVQVTDLDSRNGTFVDGRRVSDGAFARLPRLLRVGQTLFRFAADVRPFARGVEIAGRLVTGPTLRAQHKLVVRAASSGDTLLLTGPSGTGKEVAARLFHDAGGHQEGAFVAVNCAAIPPTLAERLLFGARRGAYSDATADAEGYVQMADRGTLFLDEIAELDPSVQAKLLRVLETREVLALGAAHARKVTLRICAATLKDLRAEVAAGRFREDLYYRIGRPEVSLPALCDRMEDIPWLVVAEIARISPRLSATSSFLERCALLPWPGNVRELFREIRQAAQAALDDGRALVDARDLAPSAGAEISEAATSHRPPPAPEAIEEVLQREHGNVSRAARTLGMHRNQLRRWLARREQGKTPLECAREEEEQSLSTKS
jgi:transcriptional regulator of acetoin/glycerol metabolism